MMITGSNDDHNRAHLMGVQDGYGDITVAGLPNWNLYVNKLLTSDIL